MPTKSISRKATKKLGAWVLAVFFSIFFLVGGGLFYGFFVRTMLKIEDAKQWAETPCTVLSSEVGVHRGRKSTTYSIVIVYAYRVSGRAYTSDRYDFTDVSSSGYESKAAIVARYPPGQTAVCYVNPQDPTEAVLERNFTSELYLGLIPLVFVAVGAGGLLFTLRSARRKPRDQMLAPWGAPAVGVVHEVGPAPGLPRLEAVSGAVPLESKVSPKGKLIGVAVFAVVWNGIVSIFAWDAAGSWQRGGPDWPLIVFLIPFVLIGLGAVVAAGYYLLALFNPRPKLIVSANAAPLGGTMDVQWQLTGRAHLVQRFRIYLEGREEATYRRGTRTYTDRETFAQIDVLDVSGQGSMFGGGTRFTVPRDTMHTFESSHNKIVWSLRVHGDVRRWPDIEEEFEFVVLPMSPSQRW